MPGCNCGRSYEDNPLFMDFLSKPYINQSNVPGTYGNNGISLSSNINKKDQNFTTYSSQNIIQGNYPARPSSNGLYLPGSMNQGSMAYGGNYMIDDKLKSSHKKSKSKSKSKH